MSVYKYIAEMNPYEANDFCVKNGFADEQDTDAIAFNLQNIVATRGENALKKIFELHPDKEAILELFQKKDEIVEVKPTMLNATGETPTSTVAHNTNTYILLAAIIVSVAIISIKK